MLFKTDQSQTTESLPISVSKKVGVVSLLLFFGLLAGLPLLAQVWPSQTLAVISREI